MLLTDARSRRKRLTQLYLDGEEAVKVDTEVFERSGLCIGATLTDEALRELLEASERRRAKEKALYLLEHSSHSKKELERKIARTTVSREAAKEAADRMEELGLVNDETYGENLARALFERKGFGTRRVRQELMAKGLDRELIARLLEEYADEDRTQENIRAVLEKKYRGYREDESVKRRAVAGLQRLGYSFDEIRRVMQMEPEWD